jgi:hypothetical protein
MARRSSPASSPQASSSFINQGAASHASTQRPGRLGLRLQNAAASLTTRQLHEWATLKCGVTSERPFDVVDKRPAAARPQQNVSCTRTTSDQADDLSFSMTLNRTGPQSDQCTPWHQPAGVNAG